MHATPGFGLTPPTADRLSARAADAYREAKVDIIADVAGKLVKWMNSERSDELKRCAEVFAEVRAAHHAREVCAVRRASRARLRTEPPG